MFSKTTTAFVFPGQGSQKIGMGREFFENTTTKHLFEQANDALGFDLTKLILTGDDTELARTANTQPALLLTSYTTFYYLQKQVDLSINAMAQMVAGHSLGEYSALLATGVFDFETALRLVRQRGDAMQQAVKEGEGAMAAVLGLSYIDIDSIARNTGCFIANDNSDGQVVLSGSVKAIDDASNLAVMQDARKVVRLSVSAPFHCPMMQDAADVMTDELASVSMNKSSLPVICNITAQAETEAVPLRENLVKQVTGTVRWRESMIHMANEGITEIYELGTGKVLTGLAKRCDKRLKAQAFSTPEQIDNLLEGLIKNKEVA